MDSMGMSSCPISSCETYLTDLLEATIKLLLFRYIDICIWKIDIDIYLSIYLLEYLTEVVLTRYRE